jgi:hypothetical protein
MPAPCPPGRLRPCLPGEHGRAARCRSAATTWGFEVSHLIAIAYDSRETAEEVRSTLRLQRERTMVLDDALVVSRDPGGQCKLHPGTSTTGIGAAAGALWGSLLGPLLLAPLLGALVGAAGGALTDIGVDDEFARELGERGRAGDGRADPAGAAQHARQGPPEDPAAGADGTAVRGSARRGRAEIRRRVGGGAHAMSRGAAARRRQSRGTHTR